MFKITSEEKEFILANRLPKRPSLKSLKGEDFYVEKEDEQFGVFDTKVGFCWGLFPDKNKAEKKAKALRKSLKSKE